jgi:hypothetical protein
MNELAREREREFQTKKDEGQRDSEKRLNKGEHEHLSPLASNPYRNLQSIYNTNPASKVATILPRNITWKHKKETEK